MLTEQDKKKLTEIKNITEEIKKVYTRLFYIETANEGLDKTESIKQLRKLKEQENELYDELEIDTNKVSTITYYLTGESVSSKMSEDNIFNAIYADGFDRLVTSRIINKICLLAVSDDDYLMEHLEMTYEYEDEDEDSLESDIAITRLNESLDNDFERLFLVLNEENIKANPNKDKYSKVKYELLFSSPNSEDYFLDVVEKDKVYISFHMYGEMYRIMEPIVGYFQVEKATNCCAKAINAVLHINDPDDENSIMLYTYIKASFTLLSSNKESYNLNIYSIKESLKGLDIDSEYSMSDTIEEINKCLDSKKLHHEKCKYLHIIEPK